MNDVCGFWYERNRCPLVRGIAGNQFRAGNVASRMGNEGNLVSELNQSLSQPIHQPFRPAVIRGWNGSFAGSQNRNMHSSGDWEAS